jgi:predicted ATP-grasp superfamily ATP-dependent carboligase
VFDDAVTNRAAALASAVTEEFGLVGLNGIDFIARDGVPYPLEVNPRWCASMELVERASGVSVFATHAAACAEGRLPASAAFAMPRSAVIGKAIVFARADRCMGDTRAWLGDDTVRDVPQPGRRIPTGSPMCTVFATGPDVAACREALIRRAHLI